MPSPYIKSLARETGKSETELEKLWSKAKEITSDTFNKKESEFGEKEFSYTVGIVKNMVGIKEEVLNPSKFLESTLSAKEFIETITSSSFPSLDKDLTPPDEDEEEEEEEKKDPIVVTHENCECDHSHEVNKTDEDYDEDWGAILDRLIEEENN